MTGRSSNGNRVCSVHCALRSGVACFLIEGKRPLAEDVK